jgi:peptidoglycan/xylan/chitin deacetylase (PgdA/CDA1 family)
MIRSREIAILCYHGVTRGQPAVPHGCQTRCDDFAWQLDFLVEHYKVMHVDEVVERVRAGRPLPARVACVTFDDGFRNVATTAFPMLLQRKIPATVFLVTGVVGTRQPAWPDRLYYTMALSGRSTVTFEGAEYPLESSTDRGRAYRAISSRLIRMELAERDDQLFHLAELLGSFQVPPDSDVATLDWDEVEMMARSGLVRFGSHTHSHPILSRCPVEVQRSELQQSHDVLLERGLSAGLFAYPNGTAADFTTDTQVILRELGYVCGLSMIPGLNRSGADMYALRRIGVGSHVTPRQFAMRMAGL